MGSDRNVIVISTCVFLYMSGPQFGIRSDKGDGRFIPSDLVLVM